MQRAIRAPLADVAGDSCGLVRHPLPVGAAVRVAPVGGGVLSARNTQSRSGAQNGLSVSTRPATPLMVARDGVAARSPVLSSACAPVADDRTSAACSSTPVGASVPVAMTPAGVAEGE